MAILRSRETDLTMPVPEAAEALGMSTQALRDWLASAHPPPFGAYTIKEGSRYGNYIIFRPRLEA